jgi:hypothetical protein
LPKDQTKAEEKRRKPMRDIFVIVFEAWDNATMLKEYQNQEAVSNQVGLGPSPSHGESRADQHAGGACPEGW